MKIDLDDWQKTAVNHEGNLLLATGRQVGKTFTMAYKCGEYMRSHPNSQIIIASLTEDQAKLIIVMILDYLQKHCKTEIARGKNKPTLTKITLKNKATALARPVGNTGDAIRGFTGDVLVLDEVARFNELILLSAKPTLASTGGQIWMCSTFFGKQGYFYECFLNKDDNWKVIHVSTDEVYTDRPISESWTKDRKEKALKFLESEKRELSELQYAQEYLGLAVEELRQFFSEELIDKCCTIDPKKKYDILGTTFQGIDVGRMGTGETVLVSVDRIRRERLRMFDMDITVKRALTDTVKLVLHKDKIHKHQKIYIDSTGIGWGVFDPLHEDRQTKRKVVAIENVKKSLDRERGKDIDQRKRTMKEDLYINLKNLMEKGHITLWDDPKLRLSLRSIQSEHEEGGKFKLFGNYSHITEALIRAAWCIQDKTLRLYVY
jgi:hypothetical protein|tara:strand:- start:669 stop:1970 length:1302 start_codon:yes stop_codon:yes gene_type:complete